MKKLIMLLLITLLLFPIAVAQASENLVVPLPKNDDGLDRKMGSIVVSDEIYMLSVIGQIYKFDAETLTTTILPTQNADPQYEEIPADMLKQLNPNNDVDTLESLRTQAVGINFLFLDGAEIYGLNKLNGSLYRVDIAEGMATLRGITQLDFSVSEGEELFTYDLTGAVSGDSIYLAIRLSTEDGEEMMPYRFDMQSGAREPFETQGKIVEIASYKPNHLLLLEVGITGWSINDYDCTSGSSTPLYQSEQFNIPSAQLNHLMYDRWRDRVLLQSYEKVLAFSHKAGCVVVDYLQIWPNAQSILPDGRMIIADKAIFLRPVLVEKTEIKPLVVAAENLDISVNDYLQVNPDAMVEHKSVNIYQEGISQFTQEIILQASDIDIFELPVGAVTQSAREKGYYYPLNDSPILCELNESYYPFFREVIMNGDEIVAIPNVVEQNTLGYSQYALTTLGLTPKDIPSTFEGFLDFLLEWDERVGMDAHEAGITPFGIPNQEVKGTLFNLLIDWYYVLMQEESADISVLKTDMARLLDKVALVYDSIPNGSGEVSNERTFPIRYTSNEQPSNLFTFLSSFHPGRRNFSRYNVSVSDFVPIALTLPTVERPILMFEGTVLVVNPYSVRKEEALDFLNYYSQNYPRGEATAFLMDSNAVEWRVYKEISKIYGYQAERLETRLLTAQGAEKLDLMQELDLKKQELQNVERIRWEVSEQGIEDYKRAIEQSTAIWKDPTVYAASFDQTWRKYMDEGLEGRIVADHFFDAYGIILMEAK